MRCPGKNALFPRTNTFDFSLCCMLLKNVLFVLHFFISLNILKAQAKYGVESIPGVYKAAAMDLNMMITLAGAERTDKQWRALTDTAGLTIKEIFTYNQEVRESILVLARK